MDKPSEILKTAVEYGGTIRFQCCVNPCKGLFNKLYDVVDGPGGKWTIFHVEERLYKHFCYFGSVDGVNWYEFTPALRRWRRLGIIRLEGDTMRRINDKITKLFVGGDDDD